MYISCFAETLHNVHFDAQTCPATQLKDQTLSKKQPVPSDFGDTHSTNVKKGISPGRHAAYPEHIQQRKISCGQTTLEEKQDRLVVPGFRAGPNS